MTKRLLICLLCWLGLGAAQAAEGGYPLDHFPLHKLQDVAAMQNGAKLFVNYCLNCHSAQYMRYNRLRDIGLTEDQIKKNLLFTNHKVGETMQIALDPKQAKEWFGGVPPDLTVIARSRAGLGGSGADYLYTYLRTFYRDDTRPTGWNNLVFPNVGMPNVLWTLQGQRKAKFAEVKDEEGQPAHHFAGYQQIAPGKLTEHDFDDKVADLVAYLQWMGEPAQFARVRVGVWTMIFLVIFTFISWRLNAAYWKDVK